ncbi:MAG: electron transfer flavoprotein subunit alpha/FixB family protein [Anaerolineae bacterium]|nr:electron transfer flavoprotein subunit alpha/FixB family protein [Anaerolineae bacterium]
MWDELLTPLEEITEAVNVWVVAETQGNELAPISYEVLGAARDMADLLGVRAEAVLIGVEVQGLAEQLIWRGADTVYLLEHERLASYDTQTYTRVLADLVRARNPEALLFGASDYGQDLAPRLAQELDTGLLPHCTRLEVDQTERVILGTRSAYGGELMITGACPEKRPQIITVRPGAVQPFPADKSRLGETEHVPVEMAEDTTTAKWLKIVDELSKPDLQGASIVVAGGRGVGADGFVMLEELARELGAAVGASRGALDEGWVGKEYWVGGAGGTPVAPDLYVACGISGALQHYLGIKDAGFIVAINSDAEAPIFKLADLGIVGDFDQVVPALTEGLKGLHS